MTSARCKFKKLNRTLVTYSFQIIHNIFIVNDFKIFRHAEKFNYVICYKSYHSFEKISVLTYLQNYRFCEFFEMYNNICSI